MAHVADFHQRASDTFSRRLERQSMEPIDIVVRARFEAEDYAIKAIGRALRGAFRAVVNRYKRRALTVQLNDLDDHLLEDIGLRRDQIPDFVEAHLTPMDHDLVNDLPLHPHGDITPETTRRHDDDMPMAA